MADTKRTRDKALETAYDILKNQVCECGDTEGDHIPEIEPGADACTGDDGNCECQKFRPVAFRIERAHKERRHA